MGDIGKPLKRIELDPMDEPVPEETPVPAGDPVPEETPVPA